MISFGEKIESLRKENRLTQAEFAEKLGVTRTTVGKWELNKNYPNQAVLLQICKIFNCSLDALLSSDVKGNDYAQRNENKISILSRNGSIEEIVLSDEDLEMAKNILLAIKEKNKTEPKDF